MQNNLIQGLDNRGNAIFTPSTLHGGSQNIQIYDVVVGIKSNIAISDINTTSEKIDHSKQYVEPEIIPKQIRSIINTVIRYHEEWLNHFFGESLLLRYLGYSAKQSKNNENKFTKNNWDRMVEKRLGLKKGFLANPHNWANLSVSDINVSDNIDEKTIEELKNLGSGMRQRYIPPTSKSEEITIEHYDIYKIDRNHEEYEKLRKLHITNEFRDRTSGSEFSEELIPRKSESLSDFRDRISEIASITPFQTKYEKHTTSKTVHLRELLNMYDAVKHDESGGLRWIATNADIDHEDVKQLANEAYLFIPRRFGSDQMTLTGVNETQWPDWLTNDEGRTIIAPATITIGSKTRHSMSGKPGAPRPKGPDFITDDFMDMLTGKNPEGRLKTEFLNLAVHTKQKVSREIIDELCKKYYGKNYINANSKRKKELRHEITTKIEGGTYSKLKQDFDEIKLNIMRTRSLKKLYRASIADALKCEECDGTGKITTDEGEKAKCEDCDGSGRIGKSSKKKKKKRGANKEHMGELIKRSKDFLNKLAASETQNTRNTIMSQWVAALKKVIPATVLGDPEKIGEDQVFARAKGLLKKLIDAEIQLHDNFERVSKTATKTYSPNKDITDDITIKALKDFGVTPGEEDAGWGFESNPENKNRRLKDPKHPEQRSQSIGELYKTVNGSNPGNIFIELRKHDSADKHLKAMFTSMALHDPKFKKSMDKLAKNPDFDEKAYGDALAQNPSVSKSLLKANYNPKPNEILGIGRITGIQKGQKELTGYYRDEAMATLKSLHNFESSDGLVFQLLLAMHLKFPEEIKGDEYEGASQIMPKLFKRWKTLSKGERKDAMGAAEGQKKLPIPNHLLDNSGKFVLSYINIETNHEGKIVTDDPKTLLFIVKPISELTHGNVKTPTPRTGERFGGKRETKGSRGRRGKRESIMRDADSTIEETFINTILPTMYDNGDQLPYNIADLID